MLGGLALDSSWFQASDSSGAYIAWGYVQDFANTIMVIILLVIIFSQLTGWGIDNYGIKKMLPKLIVMAMLINLSFVVCQLAVDVSNIVGAGVADMGKTVATEIKDAAGSNLVETGIAGLIGIILGGGAAMGAGGAAIATTGVTLGFTGVPLAIIIIIGVVVVALIAMVIFMATLALRNLLAIVCVVAAPLALVCYVLPNTQNLYKKWLSGIKAVLVIYPVCAALFAVAKVAGAISAAAGGTHIFMIMISWIFTFVPLGLAPMLVRKALSVFGDVGGVLSKAGGLVKRGAKSSYGLAKDSDKGQAFLRNRQINNARRGLEKLQNKENKYGRLTERQQAQRLRLQRMFNTGLTERERARKGVPVLSSALAQARAESEYEALEDKNYMDQYKAYTNSEMNTELHNAVAAFNGSDRSEGGSETRRLRNAIAAAEGRGMNKEMLAELGGLSLRSGVDGDARILDQLANSGNTLISQYAKQMNKTSGADGSLKQFVDSSAGGGIVGTGGARVSMKQAFSSKGPNVMNAMDDDTAKFIYDNDNGAGSGVGVNTETLVHAAIAAGDQKARDQFDAMLANPTKNDYEMSVEELGGLQLSTIKALKASGAQSTTYFGTNVPSVYEKALAELVTNPNSSANQKIINGMSGEVRKELGL